jgi:DNA-binding helix-hairpin-helix protein with protein kinase domain
MPVAAFQQLCTLSAGASLTGSRSGLAYKLGQEIGAGVNGVVYTVARRPELVAKIQKHAVSKNDVEKLEVLVKASTPELLAVAAWPTDLLKDGSGRVIGFVMPRIVDARPLYELYSPRSRLQQFPAADFRFLVHAAANVARLFAAVHRAGFICGDVNHSNILVRQTATVAAVDCDSFQVGDGARFPCLAATELFVPPELMSAGLGATRRTVDHDSFGLAVLVFHLLFMGRHPFAGRYLGRGEMTIEQAIKESRFAYSRDASRTSMAPPPFTPPMTTVGPVVAELFERAFHPNARSVGRPKPEAWVDALESLKSSLVSCKAVAWHHHPASVISCPWCAIEAPARIKLFGGVVKVATAAINDLETLWARYLALTEPGPPRPLPVLPQRPRWNAGFARAKLARVLSPLSAVTSLVQRARSFVQRVRASSLIFLYGCWAVAYLYWSEVQNWGMIAATSVLHAITAFVDLNWDAASIAGVSAFAMLAGPLLASLLGLIGRSLLPLFLSPPSLAGVGRGVAGVAVWRGPSRRDARRAWARAAAAWRALPPPPDVSDLKVPIEAVKMRLDALAAERDAEIRACAAIESVEAQLARYLGAMRIEDAKLSNIGAARCAVLRSWGIDTAADIDAEKIGEIPGFGRTLTDKLVIWREMKEKAFTSSTTPIVDPHVVQQIDRRLAPRRMKLMKELRERIAEVERRTSTYVADKDARWARVEAAYHARLAV